MKTIAQDEVVYTAPQVRVIEVHVEKGFVVSDPSGSGEDMPWG